MLTGHHIIVTAGPTHEPIDPVRYIANRSSGKQGFAIAGALAALGARVTLVAGPVTLPTPPGVDRIDVETALEMSEAVDTALPADAAVMVAAVADWRVDSSSQKIKKGASGPPVLHLVENPDILATVARLPNAPYCVGFAAESGDLEANGEQKRVKKNVPLIIGNLGPATFGRDDNEVVLFEAAGATRLPRADKDALASVLIAEIARRLPDASLIS